MPDDVMAVMAPNTAGVSVSVLAAVVDVLTRQHGRRYVTQEEFDTFVADLAKVEAAWRAGKLDAPSRTVDITESKHAD